MLCHSDALVVKKKRDSHFFLLSSLENEAKNLGERTQVTLDDQIYISLKTIFFCLNESFYLIYTKTIIEIITSLFYETNTYPSDELS